MELGLTHSLHFWKGGFIYCPSVRLCVRASVCPLASQRDGRQRVFLFFSKYSFYNNFANITQNGTILSAFEIYRPYMQNNNREAFKKR